MIKPTIDEARRLAGAILTPDGRRIIENFIQIGGGRDDW